MKATPLAAFVFALAAALCAFAPGLASAQNRDNVYAVGGVSVDETAANAAAAQEAAFAAAQRSGFERLVRRLTVPDELAARGVPQIEGATLDRLVLSVDVEEERRSATRYLGRLTVRYDPTGVRSLLRAYNLSVVDTRTSAVLVAAQTAGATEETAEMWREAWANGGFGDELVPLALAPAGLSGAPDWNAARPYAQAAGARSALYATLQIQGGTASADLVEVADGVSRPRGTVSAPLRGTDENAVRAAFASLAEQASTRLQNEWKTRIAVGAGQRARVSASALYNDEGQWERIKQALEGAAQTVISEIRIEAVGRQGALVSFSFVGDGQQLAAELARYGVEFDNATPIGPTLRLR